VICLVRRYTKWTAEDSKLVIEYFNKYVYATKDKRLPGEAEILKFKASHPSVTLSWDIIKTKVMIEKKKVDEKAKLKMKNLII